MATPKIGLSMLYTLGEPFKKMVEEIPKTNAKHIELVDEGFHALNRKRVLALRNVKESCDLEFAVHAPFAGINIALPSGSLLNATIKRLRESIVNAAGLDCVMWVLHPGYRTGVSMFYPGRDWVGNLESVRLLWKFAAEHGVRIGIENVGEPFLLGNVAEFKRFYNEVDVDVGLVLDTGHANLCGEVDSFVTQLSDKLVHIHAQDNVGGHDQHLGIGYGNINWESFADQLKKVSFDGIIIVESVEHTEESMQRLKQLLSE